MTHYLDEDGNIPTTMHKEARELASFMALVMQQQIMNQNLDLIQE